MLEATEETQPTSSLASFRSQLTLERSCERHPEIRPGRLYAVEVRCGYADDGERTSIESESLTENARIGAEATLPKGITQNCGRLSLVVPG